MRYKVMLDSGAWSAHTQGVELKIDDYISYIRENTAYIDHYVNFDVIGDGEKSYRNYLYMRDKGLDPLPVFHIGTDLKYLEKYLQNTDYIALGAIAKMETRQRMRSLDRVWNQYLIDSKGYPIAKFHGFGLTSLRIIKLYPWMSVDSSSWVQYGRYGLILVPHRKSATEWDYTKDPYKVVVSNRKVDASNHLLKYPEMVKRQILDYCEQWGYPYEILSTDGISRDKLNLIYYLGVQRDLFRQWPRKIKSRWSNSLQEGEGQLSTNRCEAEAGDQIIYIAGNFPIMSKFVEERSCYYKHPKDFNRLISFFFQQYIHNVIKVKKEILDGSRTRRIIKAVQ